MLTDAAKVFLAVSAALWLASSLLDNDRDGMVTALTATALNPAFVECSAGDRAYVEQLAASTFTRNGFIRFKSCEEQTMTVTMRGNVVNNQGAYVVVSQGVTALWEGFVGNRTTIAVPLSANRWTMIALMNSEASGQEGRTLWLESIEFQQF